jgi:hypothetical protein
LRRKAQGVRLKAQGERIKGKGKSGKQETTAQLAAMLVSLSIDNLSFAIDLTLGFWNLTFRTAAARMLPLS